MEQPAANDFDKFRFGVFEGDLFSNLWLAFTQGNEFYLGVRSQMGRMKVSFHGSGVCHVKIAHRNTVETKPRWKRPPTPDEGALHVASVCFPGGYNRRFKPAAGTPRKPLFGIQAAGTGQMVEFGFFYSRQPLQESLRRVGLPMVYSSMPSCEVVSVVARLLNLDVQADSEAMGRLRIPADALEGGAPVTSDHGLSAILINEPSETTPVILTNIQGFNLIPSKGS